MHFYQLNKKQQIALESELHLLNTMFHSKLSHALDKVGTRGWNMGNYNSCLYFHLLDAFPCPDGQEFYHDADDEASDVSTLIREILLKVYGIDVEELFTEEYKARDGYAMPCSLTPLEQYGVLSREEFEEYLKTRLSALSAFPGGSDTYVRQLTEPQPEEDEDDKDEDDIDQYEEDEDEEDSYRDIGFDL